MFIELVPFAHDIFCFLDRLNLIFSVMLKNLASLLWRILIISYTIFVFSAMWTDRITLNFKNFKI